MRYSKLWKQNIDDLTVLGLGLVIEEISGRLRGKNYDVLM